jgi:DNA replication protein DnaC
MAEFRLLKEFITDDNRLKIESVESTCELHQTDCETKFYYVGKKVIAEKSTCALCIQIEKDRIQAEREQEQLKEKDQNQDRINRTIKNSGIYAKYQTATFENFSISYEPENQDKRQDVVDKVLEYVDEVIDDNQNSKNLVLSGSFGTGKTHLAVATLKALAKNYTVLFVTFSDLVESTACNGFKDKADIIYSLSSVDFLFVDELVADLTKYQHSILEAIIINRYNNSKPTVFITNLNQEQITVGIGERLSSRIFENSTIIEFNFNNYRLFKKNS